MRTRSHLLPVSNGLLEYPHRERMGSAVWLFLQLIDWTTSEDDGVGKVLGGQTITVGQIAQALRRSDRQVKDDLKTLRDHGYINVRRLPYGMSIEVLKSKKFRLRDRQKTALPEVQETAYLEGQETAPLDGEIGRKLHFQIGRNLHPLYNTTEETIISSDFGFEEFYEAYPKHEAKEPAKKAWKKLNPSPQLITEILSKLELHKAKWSNEGREKKHIPLPATWLNGRRWEDELEESRQPKPRKELRA